MVITFNWCGRLGLLYLLLAFFTASNELEDPENFSFLLPVYSDF